MRIDELFGAAAIDLSIPLRFNEAQPNAYGVEPASSETCEYGDLIGDTRRGGSCNFERITFIPHCNGTHTECVGHITDERISVRDCLKDVLLPAVVITVQPETIENGDRIITVEKLQRAITIAGGRPLSDADGPGFALVVRTLPNTDAKLSRLYDQGNIPAYFSPGAIKLIVELGCKHLLADLPSIDRIYDEGKLANHRLFWNVEPGSREATSSTRRSSTITELIYVPNEVSDGEYLLNLQIAPFASDASPSRPLLLAR